MKDLFTQKIVWKNVFLKFGCFIGLVLVDVLLLLTEIKENYELGVVAEINFDLECVLWRKKLYFQAFLDISCSGLLF